MVIDFSTINNFVNLWQQFLQGICNYFCFFHLFMNGGIISCPLKLALHHKSFKIYYLFSHLALPVPFSSLPFSILAFDSVIIDTIIPGLFNIVSRIPHS